MQPVVGQADAGEDDGRAAPAQRGHDRDRAPRPGGHRAPPYHLAERLIEQLEGRVGDLHSRGVGAVQELDARLHVLRCEPLDGSRELAFHHLELLIGDEAQAHLRLRLSGDDRFRPVAGETPHDAVDFEGRERPQALEHGILLEARQGSRLYAVLQELGLLERQAPPRRELRLTRSPHSGVEAGHMDLPVRRLEPGEESHQLFVRVRRGAAEFAGVEVRLGGAHGELGITQAAQRGVHRRPFGSDVGHVGDEDDVGAGALGLAAQQLEQHAAAVLLLALDQEPQVDG